MKDKKIAIISVDSDTAEDIFEEILKYGYRKEKFPEELRNEKIYVYSNLYNHSIIGYVKVDNVFNGNLNELFKFTQINKNDSLGQRIKKYFGRKTENCYAMHLYDVTEFEEPLRMSKMKYARDNIKLSKSLTYIDEQDPLFDLIKEWDRIFSLDGEICENKKLEKNKTLTKIKERKIINTNNK